MCFILFNIYIYIYIYIQYLLCIIYVLFCMCIYLLLYVVFVYLYVCVCIVVYCCVFVSIENPKSCTKSGMITCRMHMLSIQFFEPIPIFKPIDNLMEYVGVGGMGGYPPKCRTRNLRTFSMHEATICASTRQHFGQTERPSLFRESPGSVRTYHRARLPRQG